jgi:hypothetical protein
MTAALHVIHDLRLSPLSPLAKEMCPPLLGVRLRYVPTLLTKGDFMSILQPRPKDVELMRYMPTASAIDRDNLWIKQLAREADARRKLNEAIEEYVQEAGVVLALQHIREFGAVSMGSVKR